MPPVIHRDVPLAPLTTFELGGPARFFCQAATSEDVVWALRWAGERNLPVFVLGGGSNVVVGEAGFFGLVLQLAARGTEFRSQGDHVLLEAQAAEPWDDVVAAAVARDLAGIECLSGIPGSAGATPIQNVGAYGQEVADTLCSLRVLDRRTLQVRELPAAECGFAYRNSVFKRDPERAIVLSASFALRPGAEPMVAYRELANALAGRARASLAEVREAVLDLRRKKSMVYDANDPNRRSAGSFFTNPIVSADQAAAVSAQAVAERIVQAPEEVPQYPLPDGRVKLAAGWLVERAGVQRGLRMGPVGVSSRHALALVHHGGGSTADLIRLAVHVRDTVALRLGITLVPEPVFLGVSWPAFKP
ncbi:MAG: UDP-N-acetylmuramate dehydrogenase [Polyangia bacterium]